MKAIFEASAWNGYRTEPKRPWRAADRIDQMPAGISKNVDAIDVIFGGERARGGRVNGHKPRERVKAFLQALRASSLSAGCDHLEPGRADEKPLRGQRLLSASHEPAPPRG